MDSRLLNHLNAQAAGTQDPVVWAKAVCRAASHFASHGKTDEALRAIGVVRAQFGKNLHFDIASWLMLAEGVLHYFKAEVPQAYDRIRRAYGLALALRNASAFPSCAAWMAFIEFYDCKYDEMAKHLEEAFTLAMPNDNQAIARASSVMAISYHLAGDFESSRPWYEKARLKAAAEGDDATISAIIHNMASFRAADVRLIDAFGGDSSAELKRVTLEAGSSLTYDYAIGHRGLKFLTLMLGGLIATLDKRYREALALFEQINLQSVPPRLRPLILVDQAWCWSQCGLLDDAWGCVESNQIDTSEVEDDDDLAYINARLCQIAKVCNRPEYCQQYLDTGNSALARHRAFQSGLLGKLTEIKTSR